MHWSMVTMRIFIHQRRRGRLRDTSTILSALRLELPGSDGRRTNTSARHGEDDYSNDAHVELGIHLRSDQHVSLHRHMQVREEQALSS